LGVAGVGSYTSDSMNLPIPGFQLMPARGVNFISGCRRTGVAAGAEAHHAGLVVLPQKYAQLASSVRSVRDPRIRVNPGTMSYALLLTLPVALDFIGMTAYTYSAGPPVYPCPYWTNEA
jgi:hypothetical protein